MQSPASLDWDERILHLYQVMYAAYDDDVDAIPPQNHCEVRFEDLEQDPIRVVQGIYESLSLPSFAAVEDDLRS